MGQTSKPPVPVRLHWLSDAEITIANVARTGQEMIFANGDGTLKRAVGIGVSDGSLTVKESLTVSGATNLGGTLVVPAIQP